MRPQEKIIAALDVPSREKALELARKLSGRIGAVKVGLELIMAEGPQVAQQITLETGLKVFLDPKLKDIPNTVAGAVRAAKKHGVWMLNVHTLGGEDMMRTAKEAATNDVLVIGVTILTSLDEAAMQKMHHTSETLAEAVLRLALSAKDCGLDGVVCSAQEAQAIRKNCGDDFLIITPGIRPKGADVGDQKRVATPSDAIRFGANYMVIGRPITGAAAPAEAAKLIADEISAALAGEQC